MLVRTHDFQRYFCRRDPGITIRAGADTGKGDTLYAIRHSQCQRVAVTITKMHVFTHAAALPDRPHGMNDPSGGQIKPGGYLRLPRPASTQGPVIGKERRSGRGMNGAVNAAATQQGMIRRIDDGVYIQSGDIRLQYLKHETDLR